MAFLEVSSEVAAAREKWRYRGAVRPAFAEPPAPAQESVWDYPRPPRVVADGRRVVVQHGGTTVAASSRCVRVLETAGAPCFYLPPDDVNEALLVANGGSSLCEWKGLAHSFDLLDGADNVAWSYREMFPEFDALRGWYGFYPGKLDCAVDGQRVRPQPGGYYGGWVTDEIIGPIKGGPGTGHW